MSKKQWMVLLMLFVTYLLLGASIFYHIESRLEVEHVKQAKQERIEINALLHKHYMPHHAENQHEILEKLTQYCGKSVYNYTEGETDPLKWDFYNSFYFAYTVVSTIGYGNLAPTNMLSRILMIFYGLVGIPMNGILLSQLGEFFSLVFIRAHQKYKSYKKRQCDYPKKLAPLESRKAGLAAQIFMYLTPGFIMFIFFPAFLFSHYEGWTYDEAVYYAFVTLTTIGFGDYVAGQDNTKGSGVFFILYKSFLICWISFGLGYIVMIMTFIARGMRSKKITRLEHKLAMNLKHTQSKIWNEFNKEVNYLRRVFNELQLSKVKRVYVDECDYETPPAKFQRSSSFPDLRDLVYGGLESPAPPHPRRRANSEVVPMEEQVTRVVSETDLQRIDKTATFATHAMVQPAELLARLVNILGYIPPPDDSPDDQEMEQPVGGQGEKEVLANDNSNWDTTWRIGNVPLSKPRSRAASEVRLETNNEANIHQQNGEWTWSGPAASRKIQELIKARRTGLSGIKDAKSKFRTLSLPKSVPKTLFPRWMMPFSNKKGTEDASPKTDYSADNNDNQESYSTQTTANAYSSSTNDRRYSTTRPYFTHTGADLPSYLEGNNLLEDTTLADFLRALTVLHTRVVAVPDDYVTRKPQRKMGTASLTPPKLPSLLALFSPPSGSSSTTQSNQNTVTAAQQPRRYSLMTTDNSGTSASSYNRRGSLALAPRLRRFSLRPVSTPATTPPPQSKPFFTNGRQSSDGQSPPPYSTTNSAFVVESPKEPLVQREGAPGVSPPVTSAPNIRRFSLRPAQIGVPPAPATPKPVQTKVMPRWKAGMLQRQIGQLSLQKRARAFSLSDVNVDGPDRGPSISPLVLSDARIVTSSLKDTSGKATGKPSSSAVQKTVTIASPEREEPKISDEMQQSSKPISPVGQETIGWTNTLSPIPSVSSFDDSSNNPFVFTSSISPSITRNGSAVESKPSDFGESIAGRQSIDSQLSSRKTYYDNKAFEGDSSTKVQPVPLEPMSSTQSAVESTVMAIEGSDKDFSSRQTTTINLPDNTPFVFNPIETGNQIPFVQVPSPSSFHHNEAINIGLQKCLLGKNSEEQLRDSPSRLADEKNSNLEQLSGKLTTEKVSSEAAKKDEQSFGRRVLDKDAKSRSRKVSTVSQKSTGTEDKPSRKTSSISIGTWADAQRQRKESTISQASVASSASSSTVKHPDDKPRVSIDSYKPLLEVRVEKPSVNPFEQYKATMKLNQDDNTALTEVKVDKPAKESTEDDYNFSPD